MYFPLEEGQISILCPGQGCWGGGEGFDVPEDGAVARIHCYPSLGFLGDSSFLGAKAAI